MSKKGAAALQKDAPWRASSPGAKPIPKIHLSPVLRIPQTPYSSFALSIMKNPDPVGNGLGVDAVLESAGPDCIVPGQATPVKLLGLKEMPFHLEFFASHCGTSVSWHSSLANNIIMVAFLVLLVGRFVKKNNHLVLCGLTEYGLLILNSSFWTELDVNLRWLEG